MSFVPVPVSIVKCKSYDEGLVYQKVKEAVDLLGGMTTFVAPGQKVLLKPNLLSGRPPEKCVTTHPLVVKAVATLVQEAGALPIIGDSPQLDTAQKAARKCGIEKVAEDLGIDIVEFEPVTVPNPDGKMFKNFTIGKIVKEADKVINIAKLKTHSLTTLTLAVKNLLGCVPGTRKAEWHFKTYQGGRDYFTQLLLDLYTLVNPVLNIIDGVMAMEGMGPGFGKPRHVGLLIAGADGVAVDRIASEAVNVPPESVSVLQMALQKGYGRAELKDIKIVGERLEEVRVSDFKLPPAADPFQKMPKMLLQFLKTYLTNHPVIIQDLCEVCSLCLKACPMKCITRGKNLMKMDKKACIQCFCCMEACPQGAINIKPGGLLRAYQAVRKFL
jgi:uncharacterized protein (DUF362 family)/Pyruvate/2-oxoacid:ferredoxin oxidoreductase delta subunit